MPRCMMLVLVLNMDVVLQGPQFIGIGHRGTKIVGRSLSSLTRFWTLVAVIALWAPRASPSLSSLQLRCPLMKCPKLMLGSCFRMRWRCLSRQSISSCLTSVAVIDVRATSQTCVCEWVCALAFVSGSSALTLSAATRNTILHRSRGSRACSSTSALAGYTLGLSGLLSKRGLGPGFEQSLKLGWLRLADELALALCGRQTRLGLSRTFVLGSMGNWKLGTSCCNAR